MLHVRNTTHQDGESMVIKANRKHQIVLNMEVKRIEMEKKMRERYFCFEMSLMKARRLKILDRQKSLGIYHPHIVESGKDVRRTESFFFTQPVAMDSKAVKLPPVSERRRTISGFPVKLANSDDSQITSKLPKNIDRNNFLDKERSKRPNATEMKEEFEDGQSKNHSKLLTKESPKIDEIKAVENRKPNNGEIGSLGDVLSKNLVIENDESQLQLASKNLGVDNFGDGKEKNVNAVNGSESSQQKQKENRDLNCNTVVQEFREEPSKPQFLRRNITTAEITSTRGQNNIDLPGYHELQAWRKSWETRILNSVKDFKVTSRLKSASASGYGKDIDIHEASVVKVRPQTALARLLKDERKLS